VLGTAETDFDAIAAAIEAGSGFAIRVERRATHAVLPCPA